MTTSVFVSHVYEDLRTRDSISAWAQGGQLGPNVVVTGESEDVRAKGDAAVRAHLSPKLQGASAVLVLVGNDTHNHRWIEYEIQHALSNHKLVVLVRIPNTTGAPPGIVSGRPLEHRSA
jgi:hypothetical protein